VWPWIIRATSWCRNAAATAFALTSMIDSAFSAFSLWLLRRSHQAMARRTLYGRRSRRACVSGLRIRARYAWYSASSVHSSSPWHSSVRVPATSTTMKSGSSVAAVARAKRSPIMKSRLPRPMNSGTPAPAIPRSEATTVATNGSRIWSSPTHQSKRSPRM
jgi:hypothetical protein